MTLAVLVVAAAAGSASCEPAVARAPRAGDARATRADALRRAQVWRPPGVPIALADLTANPPGPEWLAPGRDVPCRFRVSVVGGATPKFECMLPDGTTVKVRYGRTNPEIPAEVAATRLMSAVGFPTDSLYAVRSVACEGCPSFPFTALRCYRRVHLEWACMPFRDEHRVKPFSPVVVEVRHPGEKIETFEDEGWAWYELDRIEPGAGAPRAHVDALRLMAVFLAHWDNKSANQRLVCEPADGGSDGRCTRPLALVQDLGGSFGPFKGDLAKWSSLPFWQDARSCTVSMEHLPFEGGTFPPRAIGEAGRRMFVELLGQFSDQQLRDLFRAAGFASVDGWVRAFKTRLEQARAGGPCPES